MKKYTNQISSGLIHCHTENSKKDSAQTVKDLVSGAAKYNCPAITITNHGVMLDVYEFMKECKKQNIKGVPGVECYYKETENVFEKYLTYDMSVAKRSHILLLAKDDIGFKALCKIVSESYNHLDSGRTEKYPCINFALLKKYLGKNTEGYGHVFVSSACMAGVLSSILLSNFVINKEILKKKKKREKYNNPESPSYLGNKAKLEELKNDKGRMMEKKKELTKLANKKFTAKEKTLASLKEKNPEKYEEKKKEFDELKLISENAKQELELLLKQISNVERQCKLLNEKLKEEEKTHDQYKTLTSEITYLEEHLYDEKVLYNDTKKMASYFENLLGKGNFYIELQYHRIEEEAYVMPLLAKIAEELNIPVVATNDVHITTNSDNDVKARQIQRSLRFNEWEEVKDADKELYIKTDKELSDILLEILPENIVDKAMNGINDISTNCNVEMKTGSHYPKFVSSIENETSDEALRRLAFEGIDWRFPNKKGWTEQHLKRLEYELGVISSMGYADYHLIVQDFLNYGRLLGKLPDDEIANAPLSKEQLKAYLKEKGYDVGLGIGPGRGSGVGSLVCYLLGITSIDPLKYNLLFERFLNVERVSMPDIDSDFKTNIREKCVEYVKHVYGEESVCRIMTKGTQAAKNAIRNCARLLGSELYDDTATFLSLGDSIAKCIPNEIHITIDDCLPMLKDTFKNNKNAMTIINNARLVEGRVIQYGMHAAGVIITDGNPVSDYVPLMFDEKNNAWKTQCDMVESEENGLLKMDFLGLNNLDIITETLRLIKKRHGISIDAETVPIEKEVLKHIFASGKTNAVFQFESTGMKSMLKQFKPDCFEDLILLVAAYRPGPMQYLPKIIDIKNKRAPLTFLVPELEPILGNTYGSIIYQEQVMEIFQSLAGYSLGQADLVRRAMSKKKTEVLLKEREAFVNGDPSRNIKGCVANGIPANKANELFDEMTEFAKYAFNKSHATAYAFVSYITAYLKFHYPVEYICAVMKNIKSDKIREKIPGLMEDMKTYGIELLPPNVNLSDISFSINNNDIIFGLGSIKGVGDGANLIIKERSQNGPFKSFNNFIERIGSATKKNVLANLIYAGALDIFCSNRAAMISKTEVVKDLLKKITEDQKKLSEKLERSMNDKRTMGIVEKIEGRIEENKKLLDLEKFNLGIDDSERLIKEKELTGLFITASPLDDYNTPTQLNCVPLSDVVPSHETTVMGIIQNCRIIGRKKDGKPMAFFDLEDGTGVISVCCFAESYSNFGKFISENKVVKICGEIKEENDNFNNTNNDEEEEVKLQLIVKIVEEIPKTLPDVLISVNSLDDWQSNIYPYIKDNNYVSSNGYNLLVMDKLLNEIRICNFKVSQSILRDKVLTPVVRKKQTRK